MVIHWFFGSHWIAQACGCGYQVSRYCLGAYFVDCDEVNNVGGGDGRMGEFIKNGGHGGVFGLHWIAVKCCGGWGSFEWASNTFRSREMSGG